MNINDTKLTLKQAKFIKYYFECNGNASEAARKAGYKKDVSGRENLQNPTILAAIERIKEKNGLTEERLLEKHVQLLDAKRIQACDVYVKNANGRWVVNKNSNDFIEVDDFNVQLGALKLAYDINGKLKQKVKHSDEITLTNDERNARINRLREILRITTK
jgi:hypothetical protein